MRECDVSADAAQVKSEIDELVNQGFAPPGIAVLLVGNRKDSAAYVRVKKKACQEVGMNHRVVCFPEDVDPAVLVDQIRAWNADSAVHGIIIQVQSSVCLYSLLIARRYFDFALFACN